ncbi:MAG: hypothetical protein MUO59_01135 [Actinobacteria bacterium]|nr:hypothetical protein [Actinomycetota bacterium]
MSGFFDNLKKAFTMPADDGSRVITFKIICGRCREEIIVRASKTSDISSVYEGEGPGGAEYYLRKEILGNNCNNLMYIDIHFGPGYNIISKEITGGKFTD